MTIIRSFYPDLPSRKEIAEKIVVQHQKASKKVWIDLLPRGK